MNREQEEAILSGLTLHGPTDLGGFTSNVHKHPWKNTGSYSLALRKVQLMMSTRTADVARTAVRHQ